MFIQTLTSMLKLQPNYPTQYKCVSKKLKYSTFGPHFTHVLLLIFPGPDMELTHHDGTVRDLVFMQDSASRAALLISGGAGDCKIYVTDCETGTPVRVMSGHSGEYRTRDRVQVQDTGSYIYTELYIAERSSADTPKLWWCMDIFNGQVHSDNHHQIQ